MVAGAVEGIRDAETAAAYVEDVGGWLHRPMRVRTWTVEAVDVVEIAVVVDHD